MCCGGREKDVHGRQILALRLARNGHIAAFRILFLVKVLRREDGKNSSDACVTCLIPNSRYALYAMIGEETNREEEYFFGSNKEISIRIQSRKIAY